MMFVRILSICLLLAAGLEDISPIFKAFATVSVMETDEESKGKETEFEKDKGGKEKLSRGQLFYQTVANVQSLHGFKQIHFTYYAYLSLPEIPPDQA